MGSNLWAEPPLPQVTWLSTPGDIKREDTQINLISAEDVIDFIS